MIARRQGRDFTGVGIVLQTMPAPFYLTMRMEVLKIIFYIKVMQDCQRKWQKKKNVYVCKNDLIQSNCTIKLKRFLGSMLPHFIKKGDMK